MAADWGFLGRGWGFAPTFDTHDRSAVMVTAEDDIAQSLRILMGTRPGERVMQPDYGCNLRRLVFEPINLSTVTDMKDTIARAIRFFEPRIVLDLVTVDESDWREGVLKVCLDYRIITTNTRHNLVFPLYLREGTSTGYQA